MAKQDYIPKTDGDFLTWHDNFRTQIAAIAAIFGLLPAEVEALLAGNVQLHTKYEAAVAAKAMSLAKNAEKLDSFKTCITAARALANRIKTHPAYTPAFGQQLGIIGAEDSTDLSQEKPTLKATAITPGSLTIGFNKSTSSGVRILSKRGPESAFTFLATDTGAHE